MNIVTFCVYTITIWREEKEANGMGKRERGRGREIGKERGRMERREGGKKKGCIQVSYKHNI